MPLTGAAMSTIAEARERQLQLQRDGKLLLERFGLLRVLATFGSVESIGSFSYGLMQVPDLDFKIYCEKLYPETIRELGGRLAARPDVLGIRLLDFTKQTNGERSGIYLNVYPEYEGELWKLDLL